MREFIRVTHRVLRAARHAPLYARDGLQACRVFTAPAKFLAAYIIGRSLRGECVRLRDGFEIETSESPSDTATLMVVLVREDYAPIPPGSLIVDIGANIGAFVLYAARAGARRVIAFEPSRDAFAVLRRNVERNKLADRVVLQQLAVVGRAGSAVWFPTASSPANRIFDARSGAGDLPEGHLEVPTTSVAEIVERYGDVDLLKLDCEGAEYDIVSATPASTWSRIRALRLEYHNGRAEELIRPLQASGFRLTNHARDVLWPDAIGMLHFVREGIDA